MATANPSIAPATRVSEADRIPMSVPQLRLAVPEKEGWHRHWFVAKNVARAQRAGSKIARLAQT
jgi:hypothetical protein